MKASQATAFIKDLWAPNGAFALLAQLVEHVPQEGLVASSSLAEST